jgi:hypothetical protein
MNRGLWANKNPAAAGFYHLLKYYFFRNYIANPAVSASGFANRGWR